MIRALAAVAAATFVAAAITIFPSFTPSATADMPQALAKADRLPIAATNPSCAAQNWPNIDEACLRRTNSRLGVQPVRRVSTDRG